MKQRGLWNRWWGWVISWPPPAHECVSTSCKGKPKTQTAFPRQWGSSDGWCYRAVAMLHQEIAQEKIDPVATSKLGYAGPGKVRSISGASSYKARPCLLETALQFQKWEVTSWFETNFGQSEYQSMQHYKKNSPLSYFALIKKKKSNFKSLSKNMWVSALEL